MDSANLLCPQSSLDIESVDLSKLRDYFLVRQGLQPITERTDLMMTYSRLSTISTSLLRTLRDAWTRRPVNDVKA